MDLEEIKADLKEIKASQLQTAVQLALYNAHLNEHMRRTEISERRITAVEGMALKAAGVYGFLMAVSALAVAAKKLGIL